MFTLLELKRMYAGFKQNNKRITKEDFRSIFATYSKTVDVTMASEVFDVFQQTLVFVPKRLFFERFTRGNVQG